MNVLSVLLYMHLIVRRRRFLRTGCDIVWPIVMFVFFGWAFKAKDLDDLAPKTRYDFPTFIAQKIKELEHRENLGVELSDLRNIRLQKIAYYPANEDITNLIELVVYNLRLIHFGVQDDEDQDQNLDVIGFTKKAEAIDEIKKFKNKRQAAMIVFHNFTKNGKNLKYSIGLYGDDIGLRSRRIYEQLITSDPDGSTIDPFLAIQWSINKAFLSLHGVEAELDLVAVNVPPKFERVHRDDDPTESVMAMMYELRALFNGCSMFTMTYLSLIFYFVNMVAWLSGERTSGHKELLRINGVRPVVLRISHMLNALPIALLVIIGTMVVESINPMNFPCTSAFQIMFTCLLFVTCTTCFAFVCSTLLRSTPLTVVAALILYLTCLIASYICATQAKKSYLPAVVYALPYYWYQLENAEIAKDYYKSGCNESSIFVRNSPYGRPIAVCWLLLVLQIVFFSFLSWYLDLVRPGKYGVARPATFLFNYRYWERKFNRFPDNVIGDTQTDSSSHHTRYFEIVTNKEVGIKIVGVSKVYGDHLVALDNMTCDIYKGEITVLLGHNGAGKTTLMNIITGMYSATAGEVFINGYNTSVYKDKLGKEMGLCPQHNLFITDLTVREHVIFFAMLKGMTYAQAKARSEVLLSQLGLSERAGYSSEALSGGMKRRLQLACAMAYSPRTLVLDEPTSGLDVSTRRELWDLLLTFRRGDHTVLVSTHHMEEAEALGDRVMVLQYGQLQAYATPQFLKNATGGGYRITLELEPGFNIPEISKLIRSKAPMAKLHECKPTSIIYAVPIESAAVLADVFDALETNSSQLKILYINVGLTTLEEMFLMLSSGSIDLDAVDTTATIDDRLLESLNEYQEPIMRHKLFWLRFKVLVRRHLLHIWTGKYTYIFMAILTVASIFYLTYTYGGPNGVTAGSRHPSDQASAPVKVIYDDSLTQQIDKIKRQYASVELMPSRQPFEVLTMRMGRNVTRRDAGAFQCNGTRCVGAVSQDGSSAAMVVRLLSSCLAAQVNASIETDSWSLGLSDLRRLRSIYVITKNPLQMALYSTMMSFIGILPLLQFSLMKILERKSGVRHYHVMTGASLLTHWGASICAGIMVYAVLVPSAALVAIGIFEKDHIFNRFEFLVALVFWLMLYGLVFLSFIYLMSIILGKVGLYSWVIILTFFTGIAVTFFLVIFGFNQFGKVAKTFAVFSLCFPMANFGRGLYYMLKTTNYDYICEQLFDIYCQTNRLDEFCCLKPTKLEYLIHLLKSAKQEIGILCLQFVVFVTILLVIESGVLSRLLEKFASRNYNKMQTKRYHDAYVEKEDEYVARKIIDGTKEARSSQPVGDVMLVSNVHKVYPKKMFWKQGFNAVKGVSFSVKQGECFGLLGVNGAGKSTVFNILTGVTPVTRGSIDGLGHSLQYQRKKYLAGIGYCPQFNGLDEFLSARENLTTLLGLQGHDAQRSKDITELWIKEFGLKQIAERATSTYSGGERRRAAAAMGMAGRRCALLDEPTSGVDPGARRLVWHAVRLAKAARCSIIITSHSMDEMEALTDRIAVMSAGQLRAIGSASELETRHAVARIATISIAPKPADISVEDFEKRAEDLKKRVEETFTATLIDEHLTMMKFSLGQEKRLSELFRLMEAVKSDFPDLVQYYVVRDTTFEEVFIAFAKEDEAINEQERDRQVVENVNKKPKLKLSLRTKKK